MRTILFSTAFALFAFAGLAGTAVVFKGDDVPARAFVAGK
jgi:hypothetical protein